YAAGRIGDVDVNGYRSEPGVARDSITETYVAMRLKIDNFRWAGVPFYIRTGKRMSTRRTEIAIHFRQAPYAMFRDTPVNKLTPNIMMLHIQPSEGITLNLSAKVPGPKLQLGGVAMDFRYADYFNAPSSTGYETLLYDVMMGDATLFQRADMVEAGWAAVQPILDQWEQHGGDSEVQAYWAGAQGPSAADRLLSRDGLKWVPLTGDK
ncbi:MAG: glucose-6-phosphate dehydrogenase, partial [Pseudomonadota bacterium]|nr:glucose-6-phosphate dehydrogenase [Pseudomonadota bacterium]